MHEIRFPGESAEYRRARDTLLEAEVALRHQTEEVARLRRALPAGGALKEDYVFQTMDERSVRLSQLFRDGQNTTSRLLGAAPIGGLSSAIERYWYWM